MADGEKGKFESGLGSQKTGDPQQATLRRAEVTYVGHVQGVGFRYSTQRVAQQFRVTGFVRNEDNGNVFMTIEGEPGEVQRFIDAVCEQMRDFIHQHQVRWLTATGTWSVFSISR